MLFSQSKFVYSILILFIISSIGIVSAAFFSFSGTAGVSHTLGQFFSDSTTGNAGIVSFQGGGTAGIDGDRITGTFYTQTIGLVTFNTDAHIVAPSSGRPSDLWSVIGTATSNAGVIDLTGVQYSPVTRSLIGYGMNYGIGRVPFGIASTTIDPVTGLPVVPPGSVTSIDISRWFEWRVKVLGNIWGQTSFDTFYALGARFNASLMNDTLNRIRKNVSLLSRNLSDTLSNTSFDWSTSNTLWNKLFFINKTNIEKTIVYSNISTTFPSSSVDSLIIIWGDLIIDRDILDTTWSLPKGIIILKNEDWIGGNIIVQNTVKKIESSIFTQWSLYSGNTKTDLYNDTIQEITTLWENQLYIHGSLLSRNTIGGSFTTPTATCVYWEQNCTNELSIRYDLNYFRGSPAIRDTTTRAFRDTTLDTYSCIIETDTRFASNPPPGF